VIDFSVESVVGLCVWSWNSFCKMSLLYCQRLTRWISNSLSGCYRTSLPVQACCLSMHVLIVFLFRSDLSNICLVASQQTMLCLWYVALLIGY